MFIYKTNARNGRAMAQAVSCRPPTAEARVRSRGQSIWDLWWAKWHWDRFFSEYFGFPLSLLFHRCSITKKKLIIFITELDNKPQGYGASVASAAGHFTTKKIHGFNNFKIMQNICVEPAVNWTESFFVYNIIIVYRYRYSQHQPRGVTLITHVYLEWRTLVFALVNHPGKHTQTGCMNM